MTKNNLNLGSTAFIALTSAYFAIALNIKFWQFACEKIDINSFSVLFLLSACHFYLRSVVLVFQPACRSPYRQASDYAADGFIRGI